MYYLSKPLYRGLILKRYFIQNILLNTMRKNKLKITQGLMDYRIQFVFFIHIKYSVYNDCVENLLKHFPIRIIIGREV